MDGIPAQFPLVITTPDSIHTFILLKDPRLLLARAAHAAAKGNELVTCVAYYYDLVIGLRKWPSILPHLSEMEVASVHELAAYYADLARIYPPLKHAVTNTGLTPTSLRF